MATPIIGTRPEVVCGLREGASPWLLRAGGREVVLRGGRPAIRHELATVVAALQLAAASGVPVPEPLGSDDGRVTGVPLVLSARLPGSSQIPREPDPARLAELGCQAARLHEITLNPSPLLPARDRPIGAEDFAAMPPCATACRRRNTCCAAERRRRDVPRTGSLTGIWSRLFPPRRIWAGSPYRWPCKAVLTSISRPCSRAGMSSCGRHWAY